LLSLYIPDTNGEEEGRDLKVHQLNRNTLSLLDLSTDREAVAFMRAYSRVRLGFEHRNASYIFQTEVLGFVEGPKEVLLAARPERIYRERRRYQRYQLWPDHKAYLDSMPVHDISWSGLRIHSDTSLWSGDILDKALLTLPAIYRPGTEVCLYSGASIRVPRVVVSYRLARDISCYYGLYFDRQWDLEDTQKLGDFLLALRKNFLSRGDNEGA
jgi:hypothetical protein